MAQTARAAVPERVPHAAGAPYRTILRLAPPTIIATLTQSIVNGAEAVFIAHLPYPESSNGQAALLPSLILLWLFGGSLSAISVGTQAITARRYAEGHSAEAGAVFVNAGWFAATAGLALTALGYATMPTLLSALIDAPEVRIAAGAYLKWRLLGVTSMALSFALKAFFDGIGKTYVPMVSAVFMNVANVALCYALVFGRFGMPPMGIAGVGLAGTMSSYLGLVILFGYAVQRRHGTFRLLDWRRLRRSITGEILRLSAPSAVATVAVMSGFMLFAAIVGKLDGAELAAASNSVTGASLREAVNGAATTVVVVVLKMTFTLCLAFGTATATLVSQSLGRSDPEAAARYGWASVRLGLLVFGAIGLCEGGLFTPQILQIATKSEAVARAALIPMRMMGFCTPLIAVAMILTQALFGAGNSRYVMIVELVLHFACLIPLAWILGITAHGGLIGIWSATVVYVVLLAVAMTGKYARGDWRTIRI